MDAHEMVGANIRRMIDADRLNWDQFILVEHALECNDGCQTLLFDLVGPNYLCRIVYLLLREPSTPKLTELAAKHQEGCGICTTFHCELRFAAYLSGALMPQTKTVYKIVKAIVERAVLGDERAKELINVLLESTTHRWESVVAYANRHSEFDAWLREVETFGLKPDGIPHEFVYRQPPEVLSHGVREALHHLAPLYAEVMGISSSELLCE